MKILHLLPPNTDINIWKAKVNSAQDVLKLLENYLTDQISELERRLSNPWSIPVESLYGLLGTKAELTKFKEYLNTEDKK